MTDKESKRLAFARKHKWANPGNKISLLAEIHGLSIIGNTGFGWVRDNGNELIPMPHSGNVVIHDYVNIAPFVTVDRAVKGSTIIGKGTKLDSHVHIGHGAKVGEHCTIAAHSSINGSAIVGNYCTIGVGVVVLNKVKVGDNVLIGDGAIVTKDIPDNAICVGNPARILKMKILIKSKKYGEKVCIVDGSDYELVSKFKWYLAKGKNTFYAETKYGDGKILMHRLILGLNKGEICDHKNSNGLDNTRANIRKCSISENNRNVRIRKHNKIGFKGVYKRPRNVNQPYIAEIRHDKKRYLLGSYKTAIDAAKAYNDAAIKYHGEFAKLNVIPNE